MAKSRRREQAKKNHKEAMKQLAIIDMSNRERSIYWLGFNDGKKAGAIAEKRRLAQRLLKEAYTSALWAVRRAHE